MDRQLVRLQGIYRAALAAFLTLEAAEPDERVFDLASAYASLIELAGSIEFLARNGHWTAVPPVLRTMLETYVDLLNLHEDPGYIDLVVARDQQDVQALLRSLVNPRGPLAKHLASQPDVVDLLATVDVSSVDNSPRVRPLGVRQRFEMAGLIDAYEFFYRPLSASAHSNRSALRGRHAECHGDRLGLMLHKPRERFERVLLLGLTAQLLGEGAVLAYKSCGCSMPGDLTGWVSELSPDGA